MQLLNPEFFDAELAKRKLLRAQVLNFTSEINVEHELRLTSPEVISRAVPFSRILCEIAGDRSSVLLIPTSWGIWKSSEHFDLYYDLRRLHGDGSTLGEKPCHLFQTQERRTLQSFIFLFFSFGWDFLIYNLSVGRYIQVSHDGWTRVVDSSNLADVRDLLEERGFVETTQMHS